MPYCVTVTQPQHPLLLLWHTDVPVLAVTWLPTLFFFTFLSSTDVTGPVTTVNLCVSFSDPMLLGTLKYATYKPFTSCLAPGALQLPAYAVAQCAAWRHSVCLMKYHPLGTVGTCCCEAAANGARGCWASAALVLQHWNITPAGTHCSSAGCKPSSVIVTRTCSSASKWP